MALLRSKTDETSAETQARHAWDTGAPRHQLVTTLDADTAEVIASVESAGWKLDHMAVTFAPDGAFIGTRLKGNMATARNGAVVGVYLFRR